MWDAVSPVTPRSPLCALGGAQTTLPSLPIGSTDCLVFPPTHYQVIERGVCMYTQQSGGRGVELVFGTGPKAEFDSPLSI